MLKSAILCSGVLLGCGSHHGGAADSGADADAEQSDAGQADAEQFCVDRTYFVCMRENRFDNDPACTRDSILDNCLGRGWALGCHPTPRHTDNCIRALQNSPGVPTESIVECHEATLCGP